MLVVSNSIKVIQIELPHLSNQLLLAYLLPRERATLTLIASHFEIQVLDKLVFINVGILKCF